MVAHGQEAFEQGPTLVASAGVVRLVEALRAGDRQAGFAAERAWQAAWRRDRLGIGAAP